VLLALTLAGPGYAQPSDSTVVENHRMLPFMADLATSRGIELPLPFGVGIVYYHLERDIEVKDVRVGRNGAPPTSVSDFASLSADSKVDNLNFKLDAWILPFVNLYAIVGVVWNESNTRLDVTLPPILPGNPDRQFTLEVPTEIQGDVEGVGMTVAGGYPPYFLVVDVNASQANLGFDDKLQATIVSTRGGWTGKVRGLETQVWLGGTFWDTFATPTGTVTDPDGGTLRFEVDQGPRWPWTFSLGSHVMFTRQIELAVDLGTDFHGGWTLALIPVLRF
jgi:hypothetical protein